MGHLQFHNHDHLRLVVISGQTLNKLGMMEVVHQLDLSACRLSFCSAASFVELSSAHVSRLFVG